MQALRRRTNQAVAQVKRRQKKHNREQFIALRKIRTYNATQRNKIEHENWKLCQREVREKWQLGELQSTPGYLAGLKNDIPIRYKPRPIEYYQEKMADQEKEKAKKSREAMLAAREERRKNPEYNVAKGDRIVVRATEGPCARYRGNIGTVVGVNRQKRVCAVEGMTIRQARAPKDAPLYTLFSEPQLDPEQPVLLPIPFTHLRVIKTIINGSGSKEDIVIGALLPEDLTHMGRPIAAEELLTEQQEKERQTPAFRARKAAEDARAEKAAAANDEPENEDTKLAREQSNPNSAIHNKKSSGPSRLTKLFNRITGRKSPSEEDSSEKTEGKKNKETKAEEEEGMLTSIDTSRLDRDNQTWTPTLLRAPLPAPIIDELRGKYSKFRTRHDEDFLRRMQQIDSAKANYRRWAESGGGVLDTPKREVWLREQARRKEEKMKMRLGGKLDDKVLEGIGRVMWERGLRLDAKGEIEARRMAERADRRKNARLQGSIADVVANEAAEKRDSTMEETR